MLDQWLIKNDLEKYPKSVKIKNRYSNAFYKNHITYEMLPSLNDEDIDNLEIHEVSDIHRIRKAIRCFHDVFSHSFYNSVVHNNKGVI